MVIEISMDGSFIVIKDVGDYGEKPECLYLFRREFLELYNKMTAFITNDKYWNKNKKSDI